MKSNTGIPPRRPRGLKKLKRRIKEAEAEIQNILSLPYYRIFNREKERQADLAAAVQRRNSLQSQLALDRTNKTLRLDTIINF